MVSFLFELLFITSMFFYFTPEVERPCTLDAIEAVHLGQEGEYRATLENPKNGMFAVYFVISAPPYIRSRRFKVSPLTTVAELDAIRSRFAAKNYTCETTNERLIRDILSIDSIPLRGPAPERICMGFVLIAICSMILAEFGKWMIKINNQ